MLASGESIKDMDVKLKKEAQRVIPKMDEQQSIIEFSMVMADKEEDKALENSDVASPND